MRARISAYLALATLGGCATLAQGDTQTVAIDTFPAEAQCRLTREGQALATIATPGRVTVDKRKQSIDVVCTKPGYQDARGVLEAKFAQATAGNAFLAIPFIPLAVIGAAGDVATGAIHKYDNEILIALDPKDGTPAWAARAAAFKTPVSSEMGKNRSACVSWSWSSDPQAATGSPVCDRWR